MLTSTKCANTSAWFSKDPIHFQNQFIDKSVFNGDEFKSVAVVKVGQEPTDREYVHGISGGTITSQGVSEMLENSLAPYENYLKNLQTSEKQ